MSIFSKIFKNKIDKLVSLEVASKVEKELANKHSEVAAELIKIETDLRIKSETELSAAAQALKIKLSEVNLLADTYDIQIQGLNKLQAKAEDEQRKLWDKLDILRDSFTADQIWSKMWELAYSKAVDAVWPILSKEVPHLVELAESGAYSKAKESASEEYKMLLDSLIKSSKGEGIPKLKLLGFRQEIHEKMLIANRVKQPDNENKYLGQLELIDLLIGENP